LIGSGAAPAYRWGVQGRRQLTDGGCRGGASLHIGFQGRLQIQIVVQERRQLTDGCSRAAPVTDRGSGAVPAYRRVFRGGPDTDRGSGAAPAYRWVFRGARIQIAVQGRRQLTYGGLRAAAPAYRWGVQGRLWIQIGVQGRHQLTDGGSGAAPAYRWGVQGWRQLTDEGFRDSSGYRWRQRSTWLWLKYEGSEMLLAKARVSGQCCGSALVSMQLRIRIQHFRSLRIRIQGFGD
jgi:hypothetical protein